jgi:glucosyl-3-phosphoglycerate phosphatase
VIRLLLLRHAQSEWNAQGRWQGMADPPLSPRGRQQAATAGRLLGRCGIDGAVSSDLQRARATAEAITAEFPVAVPVEIEPGLREYDLGAWSGLTGVEIEARWPGAVEEWRQGRLVATPGGETRTAFVARISAAVARIVADPPAETVVVVTHGGVISALGLALGEPPRRFTHLSGFWIEGRPEGPAAGSLVSLLEVDPATRDEGEGTELAASGATATGVLDTGGR